MASTEHGTLITAAARSVLRPIGCVQKGRSRTWLDDHGWWVSVIEFQPSAWSKGSYLNVGACWMWTEKGYLSFDDGYRVETFREFKGVDSFEQSALELAERAKEETHRLRDRFSSIEATAIYLNAKESKDIDMWAHFHAGVSAGLVGWTEKARKRLAAAVNVAERDAESVLALKRRCANLLSVVNDTQMFRQYVLGSVIRERNVLKLRAWKGNAQIEF